MYKIDCRGCRGTNLHKLVSLGMSPLANNLLDSVDDDCELFPLELMYCSDCHNCQLSYSVPAEKMFSNYLYVSSTTSSLRNHFTAAALHFINKFNLTSSSLVVDVGSNDGVALTPLKENGIRVVGVDPAKNIVDMANKKGIPTVHGFFNKVVAKEIVDSYGKADVVTASNMFAHADDLEEVTHAAFDLLKDDGSFIVEVQYLLNTITDLTFDNIYHEHVNYWSVLSIQSFFKRLGYTVYRVEKINTHGGSIRVYVSRNISPDDSVHECIVDELECGLHLKDTYVSFAKRIESAKENVVANLKKLKDSGALIVGYGSPAKATTSLNYFDIRTNVISYIVEDNTLKHNKYVPNILIPIHAKQKLVEDKPNYVVVMAWNYFEEIKKNNLELINEGINFISIKDLERGV